jgi:hypothetical protein
VRRVRGLTIIGPMVLSLTFIGLANPRAVQAADPGPEVSATLDGRPIPLEDVGRYYCDDFSYPEIRCSNGRLVLESRALLAALAGVTYVSIYDLTNYGGAYMHVSQDYSALSLIGWNDRISSFKGRNSETGTFYVDWFYGGAWWTFCCNQQTSNLGTYSNTFSSILRT